MMKKGAGNVGRTRPKARNAMYKDRQITTREKLGHNQ